MFVFYSVFEIWSRVLVDPSFWSNRERLTDLKNKHIVARRKDGGGMVGELGMDMYTLLYIKWITKKVLLYITGNSAVLCSIT